ncbi:MAG: bacillithiol biosynthesis deacetylase BshB1, partial [Bacteroidia bacterium]
GIIDLTEGEMGTRGSREIREMEAQAASKIMGVAARENLKFRDGWFTIDEEHKRRIIQKIRQYRPEIILTNAIDDRHPDHGRAAQLVKEAAWLSGLKKLETQNTAGENQAAWRPKHVYHFIQYKLLEPDFVVDIRGYTDKKMEAILAYKSQFYNPNEPNQEETLIAKPEFLKLIESKNMQAGNLALLDYAEAFTSAFKPAVNNLFDLI